MPNTNIDALKHDIAMLKGKCSIPGCEKQVTHREWCKRHYMRWYRHGDALGGRKTANGEPPRYLREVVMAYDGTECLTWPYGRASGGYGEVQHQGTTRHVHRLVCEEFNGPPPTPKHEAAHSCGKGHEGCVTKRHLSWKTPKDNKADQLIHGTHNRGDRHAMAKLSAADVLAIRSTEGSQGDIAKMFGVSQSSVSRIKRRKNWAFLERIEAEQKETV